MFGNNEFTGIVLEDNLLKIARVKSEKGKLHLVKLDRVSLVEGLDSSSVSDDSFVDEPDETIDDDADSIFGLDDDTGGEDEGEINLDDLDDFDEEGGTEDEDLLALDMVEESESDESNEILLYNTLNDIDANKVRLGLNIPSGDTIFQIIRDTNFNEVKKKDLIEDLEGKLESIHGSPKSSDNYSYEIREDGSLILASVDEESRLLQLINETRVLYSGKLFVDDILPDEVILTGLVRANYELESDQITGIVQLGPKKCRLIFLRGSEIWLVSPIINEGTKDRGFLNTIFSKILFQLDTGEVPNLDRLILTNNSEGQEAVDFFKQNFPDIPVENFQFRSDHFDFGHIDPSNTNAFTTAIGAAWAASGTVTDQFPELSLLPSYIVERQKIFKLQWHGVVLLLLIFLAPLGINYFYQNNLQQINSLQSELNQVNSQITQITPTVNSTNALSDQLDLLRQDLVLMDTLSSGTREWSAKFDILNNGVQQNVEGSWLTGFQTSGEGFNIAGYSMFRDQIPLIVDIFEDATLLNVSIEEMREREVYRFSILISEFTSDRSLYSQPQPEDLQMILGN